MMKTIQVILEEHNRLRQSLANGKVLIIAVFNVVFVIVFIIIFVVVFVVVFIAVLLTP